MNVVHDVTDAPQQLQVQDDVFQQYVSSASRIALQETLGKSHRQLSQNSLFKDSRVPHDASTQPGHCSGQSQHQHMTKRHFIAVIKQDF